MCCVEKLVWSPVNREYRRGLKTQPWGVQCRVSVRWRWWGPSAQLGSAGQEVQDPAAQEELSPRSRSWMMRLEGTAVLNAEEVTWALHND